VCVCVCVCVFFVGLAYDRYFVFPSFVMLDVVSLVLAKRLAAWKNVV